LSSCEGKREGVDVSRLLRRQQSESGRPLSRELEEKGVYELKQVRKRREDRPSSKRKEMPLHGGLAEERKRKVFSSTPESRKKKKVVSKRIENRQNAYRKAGSCLGGEREEHRLGRREPPNKKRRTPFDILSQGREKETRSKK